MVAWLGRRRPAFAAVLVVFSWPVPQAATAERDLIHVGGGTFDVFNDGDERAFHFEYRSGHLLSWRIRPLVGVLGTSAEAFYLYGGLLVDFDLGWGIVATPNLTAGYYDNGNGTDLGHNLQFRSGLEIAYRFESDARLGIGIYHLSNASIAKDNPGAEVLSLVFSYPIGVPR